VYDELDKLSSSNLLQPVTSIVKLVEPVIDKLLKFNILIFFKPTPLV
jgi:hypothetical protein